MTTPANDPVLAALATRAGEAAAGVLPAVTPLSAAGAQPGNEHVTSSFAGAATGQLTTVDGTTHRVAVLVGQDLVSALADSPLGGLDLAAAVQPAVDAMAEVFGANARAAQGTDLKLVIADLGGPFTTVPLIGEGIDAAVLLADTLLATSTSRTEAPAETPPAPTEAPAPVAAPAAASAAAVPPQQQFGTAATEVFARTGAPVVQRGIEMLAGVDMEVTVELGRTRMAVRDLLALSPGTVLELDRAADGPADLLVNGRLIARGEIVVVDEDFGLRITEIVEDASA